MFVVLGPVRNGMEENPKAHRPKNCKAESRCFDVGYVGEAGCIWDVVLQLGVQGRWAMEEENAEWEVERRELAVE